MGGGWWQGGQSGSGTAGQGAQKAGPYTPPPPAPGAGSAPYQGGGGQTAQPTAQPVQPPAYYGTPGMSAMYGPGGSSASTGPVGLELGEFGAPGAWDGGYNAHAAAPVLGPQSTFSPRDYQAAGPAGQTAGLVTPAAPTLPPPMPTGGSWGDQAHLDYFRQYGAGNSGLSQEQVDALIGKPSAGPSQATVDWNQRQQDFTKNNQGYADTGYMGNADQVMSQRAGGAQAAGIPTGVLDSSFYRGGSNYGGQQNAGNTMSDLNGERDWTGSTFGVDKNALARLRRGI